MQLIFSSGLHTVEVEFEGEGSADLCSENKDADQLPGYRTADLRLCFHM